MYIVKKYVCDFPARELYDDGGDDDEYVYIETNNEMGIELPRDSN